MEHHVSRPTLQVIRAVADALEADPQLLETVREGSRREINLTVSPS
jgi:hypothetical protein